MELVERDGLLADLQRFLEDAAAGSGRLVLIGGEAGVGKTSLVHAFVAGLTGGVRVLRGVCDPLSTPRPLAPFRDMAAADDSVARVLAGRPARHAVLTGLLAELSLRTALVVEDVHWADEATLDALRFLGRRVDGTRGLVLATYRDDDVGEPLRLVLGDLATAPGCRRLGVPPLTLEGVAALTAGHPLEPGVLHRRTGGNPFYVTEVIAAPGWVVPATVSDAVLARAGRLSPAARALLERVALAPGGLEVELAGDDEALGECLRAGVLVGDGDGIGFRHALARLAVEASVSPRVRRRVHRRLLEELERRELVDAARLAHHAEGAGDIERVLRYSRVAADEAESRGARREASSHLQRAVAHAGTLPLHEQADLLRRWCDLSFELGRDELVQGREQEIALRLKAGDRAGAGGARVWLARALWGAGRGRESAHEAARAVEELEQLPPGPELADAYGWQAQAAMLASRPDGVLSWAPRAIELAQRTGARYPLMNGLIALGTSHVAWRERLDGLDLLREAADMAAADAHDFSYARILVNAGTALGQIRRYALAVDYLERTVAFADERDLDMPGGYARAWLARIAFERGDWAEADRSAEAARAGEWEAIERITRLSVLGRLRTRRGDDGSGLLEEAWEAAVGMEDLQRLWPAAAGRAEAAWLANRRDPELIADVSALLARALEHELRWPTGELAFWMWRAGELDEAPDGAAEPYALHVAGDWRGAAGAWERIGCPYERAEALADGDEAAQREALAVFTQLGAQPAADRLRERMRRAGFANVPPRPRDATRSAPAELTRRQLDVLALVAEGRTNAEIAGRLFISEKTAGHHVSAILRKLGARSRTEAAAAAHRMGIATGDR